MNSTFWKAGTGGLAKRIGDSLREVLKSPHGPGGATSDVGVEGEWSHGRGGPCATGSFSDVRGEEESADGALPPGRFFNPYASVNPREHHLPHWHQPGVYCFVGWRMGDSLPRVLLDQWRAERAAWRGQHPEPWSEATEQEYFDIFSRPMDKWLDAGRGSCPFRDPALARILRDTLEHFDGKHFELVSYVVSMVVDPG